jgi:hypothetical protein
MSSKLKEKFVTLLLIVLLRNPWSRVLEKLIVAFPEPECLLPYSKNPRHYVKSTAHCVSKIHFNAVLQLSPRSPKRFLPFRFPTKRRNNASHVNNSIKAMAF